MNFISFSGKIMPGHEPVLPASNKSYRYGDGLFETMKVLKGKILLEQLHFSRLFSGLALLKMNMPVLATHERLAGEISGLCRKNNCEDLARIRLSVFRGGEGLYDDNLTAGYIIECRPLDEAVNRINDNGLVIDLFPDGRKSCDAFSSLKSASFQLYSMAAIYARENHLNDCLVLNTAGNIADSAIANIFLFKNKQLITPALSEGCVDGVMRKHIITSIRAAGGEVTETIVTPDDLQEADEIFLTNAIKGVRWVQQCGSKKYTNTETLEIFQRHVKTIFP